MTTFVRALLVPFLLVLTACSSAASAPSAPAAAPGGPSAAASGGPGGESITTPDEAAQVVIGLDPLFAGIGPKNPDVIGACCFYQVTPTADGYKVDVEIGWGDCPSGCINRHRWSYSVGPDGSTNLLSETGAPVPSGGPGGGSTDY
jgi:hypothetical protein